MMRLQIDRLHVKTDAKTNAYIEEKIGKLDHLISRHARRSAHAEIKLKSGPGRGKRQFAVEVIVRLPKQMITTHQSADSLTAAVDMAEAKLKNQLKKYKDKHVTVRRYKIRRFWSRLER